MTDIDAKQAELDKLRSEIDRIDTNMHALLMERAEIAEQVRRVKEGETIKIRPGREADMLYRLAKHHKGGFPVQSILRVWREIIAGTLTMEGPFYVAVQTPEGSQSYCDLARDHYGAFTSLNRFETSAAVVDDVAKGKASVGILPYPVYDTRDAWWRFIVSHDVEMPKIIARLPFFGRSNAIDAHIDGFVISTAPPAASGRDISIFAFATPKDISTFRVKAVCDAAGLKTGAIHASAHPPTGDNHLFILEVHGFLSTDDPKLMKMMEDINVDAKELFWLGAYPTPLTENELGVVAPSPQPSILSHKEASS